MLKILMSIKQCSFNQLEWAHIVKKNITLSTIPLSSPFYTSLLSTILSLISFTVRKLPGGPLGLLAHIGSYSWTVCPDLICIFYAQEFSMSLSLPPTEATALFQGMTKQRRQRSVFYIQPMVVKVKASICQGFN